MSILIALMLAQAGAPIPPTTPAARIAIADFGTCVADASAAKAAATLLMDFRGAPYRNAMKTLSDRNAYCFRGRGRMRANNLLFAGAIAERLIEREPGPVKLRLAQAAARPAVASFSPSDAAALCVVRSDPDRAAALFASQVGSDAETIEIAALQPLMARCSGGRVETNGDGLRAMLATAAFRSLTAVGKSTE